MYHENFEYSQPHTTVNTDRKRSHRRPKNAAKRLCSLVLSAVLFGGIVGGTAYMVNNQLNSNQTVAATVAEATTVSNNVSLLSTTTVSTGQSLDVSAIANNGLSSVVSVTNISVQQVQNYFNRFGRGGMGGMNGPIQTQESTSVGSGVIIYNDGSYLYMVTNYHVVEDATTLSVTFVDDETYEATLCGYDEERDIAVIAVAVSNLSSDTQNSIAVASIGSSDELVVGQQVVAIGNALGYGQSVTTGIISAVDRTVDSGTTSNTYLQTDAAINPGNSGGALFNMNGELVGINTAKISTTGVEGMGYAIPISEVLDMIDTMMN